MPIIAKKFNYAEKYTFIAKKFNYAEKYTFIAKRFNYAELYQAYGHYTIAVSGLEPFNHTCIYSHYGQHNLQLTYPLAIASSLVQFI